MQIGDIVRWQMWADDRSHSGLVVDIKVVDTTLRNDKDVTVLWADGSITEELMSFLEVLDERRS